VIALDSDWHEKPAVAGARMKLAEAAARQGIPVWLADWTTNLKGLDDLLLAGGQPKLVAYQVSGSGKRPFEEVTALAPNRQPAISLEQARALMETTLLQALEGKLGEPKELGILLSPLPGTGKSTILSQVLNRYHRSRSPRRYSAYFVPRHDLAESDERKSWAFVSGRISLGSAQRPGGRLQVAFCALGGAGAVLVIALQVLNLALQAGNVAQQLFNAGTRGIAGCNHICAPLTTPA